MVRHKQANRDQIMKNTRAKLLEAAAEAFAQEGFDRANVNHIARAAGFSIGTVYNYFPSKRDLMSAFIEEIAQLHVEYIVEQVKQETDPGRRMQAFFQAGFDFVSSNIVPCRAVFNALNGPDEEFKIQLFQGYQPLFQLLSEDILNLGIDQGSFRPVDQVTIAGLLMLLYLGTGSQFSPDGKHWLDPTVVADFALHALKT